MKTLFTIVTIALLVSACGKESPFQETCYQADSGALVCLGGDSFKRYQFIAQGSTQRGNYEVSNDRIDFTRTYFNQPLYDLAYEKFSCTYRKEGVDLVLKCRGSEHMVYQNRLQVHVEVTPDDEEVLFKSHTPMEGK